MRARATSLFRKFCHDFTALEFSIHLGWGPDVLVARCDQLSVV